jgi:hypothetical protein
MRTRAVVVLGLALLASGCKKTSDAPAEVANQPSDAPAKVPNQTSDAPAKVSNQTSDAPAEVSNQPCQPGPAGPPATSERRLQKAYATCNEACWELEHLAPPGGGMPSSVRLVSCAFDQARTSVRCVVQHERLCLSLDRPYSPGR